MRDQEVSKIVADPLRHFCGKRYELGCSVVMPNHIHLTVRPYDADDDALSRIMHSWKRHSARKINIQLGFTGELWQDEGYDRIIRDEEHLWRTVQYIGRNPDRAGLNADDCQLWISPTWEAAGWKFVDLM